MKMNRLFSGKPEASPAFKYLLLAQFLKEEQIFFRPESCGAMADSDIGCYGIISGKVSPGTSPNLELPEGEITI